MSNLAPVKISVIAVALLLAMPLSAQRYQGRDHHVFHPPAQTKHQSGASLGAGGQSRAISSASSSASHSHDANLNASHNDNTRLQMPSGADSVHPH